MAQQPNSQNSETALFSGRATLNGRVISSETRQPIAGATVKLTSFSRRRRTSGQAERLEEVISEAKTNGEGDYSVQVHAVEETPNDRDILLFHRLDVSARRHVPRLEQIPEINVPISGKEYEVNVQLRPAYALEGRVTNEAGQPIEGVQVYVFQSSSHGCFNPQLVGGSPKTDPNGHFMADGMPLGLPSEQRQVAGFLHDDYDRRFIQRLANLPRDADGVAHVEVVLPSGFSFSGFVKDAKGNPVPAAKVLVMAERPYEGDPGCARPPGKWDLKTDEKGQYVAKGLSALRYNVIATHEAHPPGSVLAVDLMKGSRYGIDVVMADTGILAGQVIHPDGSPAADYELKASQYLTQAKKTARTNKNGTYRLAGFVPGISVSFEGFSDLDALAYFVPPNEAANIRLPVKVTVKGRLVDRHSREPVTAQREVLLTKSPHWGRGFQGRFDSEDGRFELREVWVGDYFICAQSKGCIRTCRKVKIAEESSDLGDIVVHAGVILRGRISGPNGQPIPQAEVFIDSEEFYDGKTVYSDMSGIYEFPKLADNVYQFRVNADGWAPVFFDELLLLMDATTVNRDVVLSKGVKITGRVCDGDKPIAHAMVILSRPKSKERWRRPWIQDTSADKDGNYVFPHVIRGEYAIRCGLEERVIRVVENRDMQCDFAWPGNPSSDSFHP